MNKKLIFTLISGLVSTQALAEINLDLNPVVVTATRSAQNSFDLPVSIDAVDSETIHDARLGANLSEVSPRIPGVVINNRYNSAQELAISTRGFGARSLFGVKGVRVYADGIPLTTPDGQGQLGALNLDTVGQVEFLRGPFSALYGNSSGGVVQVITRDGAKTPTLTGGITFGSYNTRREVLTLEGQQADVNYIVSASQITSDGYRDHSEYRKDNFNSKISFNLNEDTKLTLVANYMNQPYTDDPQALTPTQFKTDSKQAKADSYTGNTRVIRDQTYGGFTLDHNLSDTQSLRMMAYYGERSNLQYLPTSASGYKRDFGGTDIRWTYKDTLLTRPFSLALGASYDMMKDDDRRRWSTKSGSTPVGVRTTLTRDEVQKAWNVDQYAQATFEPTDRLLLIAGMRHSTIKMNVDDKFLTNATGDDGGSLEYSNTSPVLGATFKVTPTFNVYANYGEGFETPTFAEMSYSNATTGAGPNLSMKPSKTKNYEIGAKAFVTDNTRVNLALFKIDAKNEIAVDVNNAADSFTSYKSVAETQRKGLELSIDSRLPYNFSFYGAYTLMDAEFKNNFCGGATCTSSTRVTSGNKIPGTYTATTYSELMWKYPAYGFSTAVEAIYVSSTNAYDSNIAYTSTAADGKYKLDSNTLFNLRAGFTQQIDNWKLTEFARVDNLSDQSYVSSIKVNSAQAFEPGPGRNYTVGVSASYMFK
jgi:iron complex outermembrane receptor protein